MTRILEEEFRFPVEYDNETLELKGYAFRPADQDATAKALPPLVFNSGFTGGVSMYGQLFGRALARRGYNVVTYDVSGFFSNKAIRNTYTSGTITVTNVSLDDQRVELLALIEWTRKQFGTMPAVASWAMGAVASLAAVTDLANADGEQLAFYVPMSYTRISALQNLRADARAAHREIEGLDDRAPIPPFDTGTEATRTGFYPLDPDTQAYVDEQLGTYTEAGGADRWPGCSHVSAKSYKTCVSFDPEAALASATHRFPPALIVHGTANTLHSPEESVRLHKVYPGEKGDAPCLIEGMAHGQQLVAEHPVFIDLIGKIDAAIRSRVT